MAVSKTQLRLSNIEAEIENIKVQIANTQSATIQQPWWHKISGTFANDPAHADAMKLGRKYRESLRPKTTSKSNGKAAKKNNS